MDQQTINKTKQMEEAVLGCLILNPDIMDSVRQTLKSDDFYDNHNKTIYEAIEKLYSESKPIDMVTVSQLLPDTEHKLALADAFGGVGSSQSFQYYTDQVVEYSRKRKLADLGKTLDMKAVDGAQDSKDIIREVEQSLADMTATERGGGEVDTAEILDEIISNVKRLKDNPRDVIGMSTGWTALDMKLSGLHPTDLIILGARPGVGKSSFALQLARNVAYYNNAPVLMFSLEMGAEQLGKRILAAESKVSMTKIMSGHVNDAELEALELGTSLIKKMPLYFNDRAGIVLADIRSNIKLHNAKNEQPIKFVIIDYLQLIDHIDKRKSSVQIITEISRGLKLLAKDLNIPVLALSQFSRDVEKRGGKPKLSDLRDSGSIEQDADIVMFLHSDSTEPDSSGGIEVELIVAKHRNGATGEILFNFNKAKMTFLEIDESMDPAHW